MQKLGIARETVPEQLDHFTAARRYAYSFTKVEPGVNITGIFLPQKVFQLRIERSKFPLVE
jgi:hypothetical protein